MFIILFIIYVFVYFFSHLNNKDFLCGNMEKKER